MRKGALLEFAVLLVALGLGIWALVSTGPKPPEAKEAEGPLPPESGAKVIRKGSPQLGEGINKITVLLDGERANRVNQRRDPLLQEDFKELFGVGKEFHPLMIITATGPGKIIIEGSQVTKGIEIPVEDKTKEIEIYPEYNLKELFKATEEEETISIYFENQSGKSMLVDRFPLRWSGGNEIFLSKGNLTDLASIVETNQREGRATNKSVGEWIETTAEQIRGLRIRYQTPEPSGHNWQKVRTPKEILRDRQANCLDMAIWISTMAEEAGLNSYIITGKGHALVAIGKPGGGPGEATYLETTMLLEKNKQVPPLKAALEAGTRFLEAGKKDNKEILAIDVNAWKTLYRDQ